jgi:hypothetical protein
MMDNLIVQLTGVVTVSCCHLDELVKCRVALVMEVKSNYYT